MVELDKIKSHLEEIGVTAGEQAVFEETVKDLKEVENPISLLQELVFSQQRSFFFREFIPRFYRVEGHLEVVDFRDQDAVHYQGSIDPRYSFTYFDPRWNPAFLLAGIGKEDVVFYGKDDYFLESYRGRHFYQELLCLPEVPLDKRLVLRLVMAQAFELLVGSVRGQRELAELEAKAETNVSSSAVKDPAESIFDAVFDYAMEKDASDIHIRVIETEDFKPWVLVQHRIHGDVIPFDPERFYPYQHHEEVVRLIRKKCNLEHQERDGAFRYQSVNWRINLAQTGWDHQWCITARKLDPKTAIMPLEKVFLHPQVLREVRLVRQRYKEGFFIIVGETGSGKSTSLMSYLNDSFLFFKKKIMIKTIEDPIEFRFPDWLCQHQVSREQSAPKILKGLLRGDPDWILAGEIRDREMMEPAKDAVLSGHFTLATFHAASVFETILRMKRYGMEPKDIVSTTRLILHQVLLKRICQNCRIELEPGKYAKGYGCDHCVQGFRGRFVLPEYVVIDPNDLRLIDAIENLDKTKVNQIIEERFHNKQRMYRWAQAQGYLAFDDQQLFF